MSRYEVTVKVVYKVTAPSMDAAYALINDGAEFPVMPWDDETYCDTVNITSVKELSNEHVL